MVGDYVVICHVRTEQVEENLQRRRSAPERQDMKVMRKKTKLKVKMRVMELGSRGNDKHSQ